MSDIQFVTNIVGGIISKPEELKVERTVDEMGVLISVSIAKSDMGKVIGHSGSTVKAIRLLLNSFGYNANAKISLKILEPLSSN
jgi:predicted RNA-binding protein YlqC (UPF0109 family)